MNRKLLNRFLVLSSALVIIILLSTSITATGNQQEATKKAVLSDHDCAPQQKISMSMAGMGMGVGSTELLAHIDRSKIKCVAKM